MKVVKDLLYTKDHEWVKAEGNTVTIGITDYAQHALGSIVFVELPEEDESFEEGDEFAVIESVKAASDAYMPVSGTIVAINEELDDEPALLNDDAYTNWLVKVELSNPAELDNLMTAEAYEAFCNEEE
ncbi:MULTISPECIES: glycine cleavage system protein GcvH [unclassified Fusibacter]|uniref:glycine cleavage system protein GcvH n=1 Tax=unclassified Fusibacter TaxID=2624464 RepID=UPI0010112351|nr:MULTISPECIES: glycine cleavage system protein GcvH [unclassified Fusibacter]MCK8059638.1 glycine cleavage system protein GcvH [Fusibacter sp. A2]NPE21439.1 glycine cleavage system protein GcvH [Fusibacter sp. A1]RXV61851.1 glycine cleavage system protein GcvH [Fusibacter sp. A1]